MFPPPSFNYPQMAPIPAEMLVTFPERRVILCCGGKKWAKCIGWFQIVCCVFWFLLSFIEGSQWGFLAECHHSRSDFHSTMMCAVTALVFIAVGILMGIVLITGAGNENPNFLKAWLVYATVATVLYVINVLTRIGFKMYLGNELALELVFFLLNMIIRIFCIWLVYSFRREIKGGILRPEPPPPYSLYTI